MYKTTSSDYCHCKKKCSNTSNLHVKFQTDKYLDGIKNVSTQTDLESDYKSQEQIAELLSEIAVTLNQKSKLEVELTSLQNTMKRNEEIYNDRKKKAEEEISKLINYNQSKDNLLSNIKISHLEEQKALLSQINELKTEINSLKGEKERFCSDAATERMILEQKLNTALNDLKNEIDRNEICQSKLFKYKNRMKFLVKYTKQLLEALNSCRSKKDAMPDIGIKRTMSGLNEGKYFPNENVSTSSCNIMPKSKPPDIENMILAELFFKPNPVPMDVASLFFGGAEEERT